MTQHYRISLLKKLISIAEMIEKNDNRQANIVENLNLYDKLDWTHPLRLTWTKEELTSKLEIIMLVDKRISNYYQDTLTKLNNAK